MAEKELFIKEVRPDIYLLDEAHESTGYLVIGKEKACLIDTMNGYNDLHCVVRKYTDKPLVIVNTHGHPDHIFGNVFFPEVYMNSGDLELADMFIKDPLFVERCKETGTSMPPYRDIREGDKIELGGRTLEVYELRGHTKGGILLLLSEERILFTGDGINHHLWMMLDGCPPLSEFIKNLDRIMFLEKEADVIYHGHAHDYDDISLMRCLRKGVQEIIDGKTQDDKPYTWFGGVDLMHAFEGEPGKHYQQDDHVICYRKNNI